MDRHLTVALPRGVSPVRRLVLVGSTVLLLGCSTTVGQTQPVASTATAVATPIPAPTVAPTRTSVPGPSLLPSTTVSSTTAPAGTVTLVMVGPPPDFRPTSLTVSAGDVVFFLRNDSPAQMHGTHNVVIGHIDGDRVAQSEPVTGGTRAIFTVRGLPAGTYDIWCSLYEHDLQGQRGTLTVE